jgi:cobalt/nickel transport system permease protein
LILSGGVVAFLQRSDPALLKATGRGAREPGDVAEDGWLALRPLWVALGILLILTPLGILAAGSAWGEWVASDFSNPAARQSIAAASLNLPPPEQAPQGLERLSSLWTAPFARYAPPYVRSPFFGYLLSGLFGTGLVILACMLVNPLFGRRR